MALNAPVDGAAAEQLTSLFLECVVAPGYSAEARELLAAKPNLRVLELPPAAVEAAPGQHIRSLLGGLLVQERDDQPIDPTGWQVVSQRQPVDRRSARAGQGSRQFYGR